MKLFIDIETIPKVVKAVPDTYIKKFIHKFDSEQTIGEHYNSNAALYAEFGCVVCVSMAYISDNTIAFKSFCGANERDILTSTSQALSKATGLVAHNGIDFDYPFLCRRMIVNGVPLPSILQIQNLKPWEIKLEDTVAMWKFGQFGHKVSLALMCELFGIPSPKSDMDGSQVADEFHAGNFDRISKYCEGDVRALVNVYRKMNYQDVL